MAKEPSSSSGRRVKRLSGRLRDRDWRADLVNIASEPRIGWGILISFGFIIVCSLIAFWAREQPLVAVGRVMDETRTVRVPLELEDKAATEQNREIARRRTPFVYVADFPILTELQNSLENLPKSLAAVKSLDEVDTGIRERFHLTPETLAAIQKEAIEGEPSAQWLQQVREFSLALRKRPLLDEQTWQRAVQEGLHFTIKLVAGPNTASVPRGDVVNVDDPAKLKEVITTMAQDAGFTRPLLDLVVGLITEKPRATFRYDSLATANDQAAAAEVVPAVKRKSPVGQVIFTRGEILDQAKYELYKSEQRQYERSLRDPHRGETWKLWLRRLGLTAAVGAITLALAGYTGLFCTRMRRNPTRMLGAALLMAGALGASALATAGNPGLAALTVATPAVLVGVILAIAYDRRIALAFGALHGLLTCIVLNQPVGVFAVIVTGLAAAVWNLGELRDRNVLFRMGVVTGLSMAMTVIIMSLIERPINAEVLNETLIDAAMAGSGALLIAGATLFFLPTIERVFDITTGMTLIDLRDPKHPLLRELQQRAPGTYNHSLNVASIAESAADAIKADALLTYVGALYHDCGKMNKPDYFVENQGAGPNKHDKLSPAMSLLVVVGHVKDGLELAREFNLPKNIQHFIESHHGTTLVEFFYHRARIRAEQAARQAGEDEMDTQIPDEMEYRYPGPKPRTREAAILMVADAVESATRSLAEPTPSRIDALVRSIANKRLLDGQFDDCDLTLRDLNAITESISRSVAAIYHGRIVYPTTAGMAEKRA